MDPDNRRPVDFALRAQMHEGGEDVARLLDRWTDGAVKLVVTHRLLRLRRARPELFALGSYEPLEAKGARSAHVVAFARRHGPDVLVTIVPRLVAGLERDPAWGDTSLDLPTMPAGSVLRDVLTDATFGQATAGVPLSAGQVFERFPVAVLVTEQERLS
jgi:(1->4)-alpha-D-glucan 1-alpha-D-glucosylmutase